MTNKATISLICTIMCILFAGCNSSSRQQASGITVKDMVGREVVVPSEVNRIVGIRAGVLRLLVYMDAAEMVVGIEEPEQRSERPYLTAHPELVRLPSIGPLMGGDAESIANVYPDVIFTAYATVSEADALQKKTGIPVIVLECPELGNEEREVLYESFRLVGKVLSKKEKADTIIDYIKSTIEELDKRTVTIPADKKPAAYIGGVSYSGTQDISSTQPYFPPFIFTHTNNVSSSLEKRMISHVKGTFIDKEQLLLWNPDVIFIDESGLELARKDLRPDGALYSHLKAVATNKIYTLLPYNNYAINYELVLLNSWYTGKKLYPEAFEDIDIETKGNEITEIFLGKPVFNQLKTKNTFRQLMKEELK